MSALARALNRWRNRATAMPGARRAQALLARAKDRIEAGNPSAAAGLLDEAVILQPRDAVLWTTLGVACFEAGSIDRAERSYGRALELDPGNAKALSNLGMILQIRGRYGDAELRYREAVDCAPDLGQAWFNLGTLTSEQGRHSDALECFRRAVQCAPEQAEWHAALGLAYHLNGEPQNALPSLQTAIELEPTSAVSHESLGRYLFDLGNAESSLAEFRLAVELDPARQSAQSNFLFALNYVPRITPEEVFKEHLAWARRCAARRAERQWPNDASPGRKLHVGYVSPDFKNHAVAYFIEPVLAVHDRTQFEVFCYADLVTEDAVTERLRRAGGTWLGVADWTDERLAGRIREDRIDILVDLAGHSAGGKRMLMFAGKAAPVQISWLGYLNTTGLEAMDYRISDWHACPADWERYHSERLIRMPDSQWCYAPLAEAPDVGPLPARKRGGVTFGSAHNIVKISPRVIETWGRLLRNVPESRLIMVVPRPAHLADRILESFRRNGVEAERIELIDKLSVVDFLSLHNRIDINLDAFPYSGGTTTCHSLWMGVPVVTLAGQTMPSRGGASLLSVVGLSELIALDEEQYVAIAAALARDLDRLEELRRGLRERVARSPLTDAARFTRELEAAYREAWRTWCAKATR
jgi:predicted O-linked N-acetylglucosamine transferase (SPINDLY family)